MLLSKIDFTQGTTQRGIVRLVVCVAASYAWFTGNIEQAVGAFAVGKGIEGFLGIIDDK